MTGVDYLVAGQGLAGTVFALTAVARGKRVLVVDPEVPDTCSRVAAGVINPLTGPRLALGPDTGIHWKAAKAFYRNWEQLLGHTFFHETPLVRLLRDQDQVERWAVREQDPVYAPWFRPLPEDWDASPWRMPHGGFETQRCGRLETRTFLDAARAWLGGVGAFRRGRVEGGVFEGFTAKHVIWCLGQEGIGAGRFDFLPLRRAAGTILRIAVPGLAEERRIVHWGKWVVPQGDGNFRAGSNYDWGAVEAAPSAGARVEIEDALRDYLRLEFSVVGEETGIRPMARQGQPVLGRHPRDERHVVFNGLGARGALLAPHFARQLLDHLEVGGPLDPRVDLQRFLDP